MHNHPSLWLILAIANIPLYIGVGRIFFASWHDFFDCVRGIFVIQYYFYQIRNRFPIRSRQPTDREADALYPVLRLLLFVLGMLACVSAEYHLIAWFLSR